jgi:outer membrane protein TolC
MRALAAYDEARHLRDVLIPLRRRVLDETVLQYNAMNAGPLELLAARRDLVRVERMAIDARRRFAAAMIDVAALRHGAALSHAADPAMDPAAAEPDRGGGH